MSKSFGASNFFPVILVTALSTAAVCTTAEVDAAPAGTKPPFTATIKPTAAIRIDSALAGEIRPGAVVELTLSVRPGVAVTNAELSLGEASDVVLVQSASGFAIGTLAAGETWTGRVSLLISASGRLRVPVFVAADSSGGPIMRSVVVTIDVPGGPVPAATAAVDGVRSLSAVETVR